MFSLKRAPCHPSYRSFFFFLLVRAACRGGRFLGQETVPELVGGRNAPNAGRVAVGYDAHPRIDSKRHN